jgi:beta-glucanase (GH16 family)
MRMRAAVVLLAAVLSACGPSSSSLVRTSPAPPPARWTLAWSDEFDGPAGALVDATKWVSESGGHGWGTQELEYYTDRGRNASLSGDGVLLIHALQEGYQGPDGVARDYTSARLKTQGLFQQAYGRFEARIQIPRGQGLWPAFWMLGRNIDEAGWPEGGEIDVMENIGREPRIVHGTVHGPGYSGGNGIGGADTLARPLADDFHVYAVEWEPSEIRWYIDGRQYFRFTKDDVPAGSRWVFDHPHFLLLNVAVGGGWPHDPDATTTMPQRMRVDWVRVWKR